MGIQARKQAGWRQALIGQRLLVAYCRVQVHVNLDARILLIPYSCACTCFQVYYGKLPDEVTARKTRSASANSNHTSRKASFLDIYLFKIKHHGINQKKLSWLSTSEIIAWDCLKQASEAFYSRPDIAGLTSGCQSPTGAMHECISLTSPISVNYSANYQETKHALNPTVVMNQRVDDIG